MKTRNMIVVSKPTFTHTPSKQSTHAHASSAMRAYSANCRQDLVKKRTMRFKLGSIRLTTTLTPEICQYTTLCSHFT